MKKKGIEEKCITAFYTLNQDLFANIKKLFWRLNFRNSIQDWVLSFIIKFYLLFSLIVYFSQV